MSGTRIEIRGMSKLPEARAVAAACDILSEALEAASGQPWPVGHALDLNPEEAGSLATGSVLLTSLLPEVERHCEPWAMAEARLWSFYRNIPREAGINVFIFTVFRHVPEGDDAEAEMSRRVRIRRLNLAATEISRQTGAIVMDIDRALADIGGETLATDYRLQSPGGVAAAAAFMASALLGGGFDRYAPYKTLVAAQAVLAARPQPGAASMTISASTSPMKVGRRAQNVERLVTGKQQSAAFLRAALRGQIPIQDTVRRLARATAKRGVGYVVKVIFSGVRHAAMSRVSGRTRAAP